MAAGSDIRALTAVETVDAIKAGDLSPVEVLDAYIERIEEVNQYVNAFATLCLKEARERAEAAERDLFTGGRLGLLHGLPIGIKDLTPTAGIRTTYGSRLFESHVPTYDAAPAARIKENGGVIVGKTTSPEFGSHVVTFGSIFGITRNPWNLSLTPGGSSGGSAAAVAAGMLPVAHGTDGGGSIRVPAAHTGLFGFKPSYGRVSNAPSTDHYMTLANHGPLSRTVADGLLLFRAMAGYDPRDPYSLADEDFGNALPPEADLSGLRVAWSPDLGYARVDPVVAAITEKAALAFADLGAEVTDAHPGFPDPRPYFNPLLALHMCAGQEETFRERRNELEPMTVAILEILEATTPWEIANALEQRSLLYEQSVRFFETYDLLLTPTMGALPTEADAGLGSEMRIEGLYFTHPFNLNHLPAASVPAGFTDDGIPVGLQIVAGPRNDKLVFRAAAAFERARPWAHERAPLSPAAGREGGENSSQ